MSWRTTLKQRRRTEPAPFAQANSLSEPHCPGFCATGSSLHFWQVQHIDYWIGPLLTPKKLAPPIQDLIDINLADKDGKTPLMVSWLIFCSLIHGVSFPLVLGLFGIHKVWLEHLLTNKSHIFPATCRFIEWFCWQYFRMFNSNGLKCLKCELSTNKSRWQRGMDMQRCLGKIFLKLQQYRHGLSAEVVAALLKAGADIGLVDKSVKDCCQDWYAKAATGQLILTPIDIITDYTKLLHFFLCVCVRACVSVLPWLRCRGPEGYCSWVCQGMAGSWDQCFDQPQQSRSWPDGLDRATFYCCIAGSRTG